MYLHLGEDTLVSCGDVIGIFDIENTSVSRHTKNFLYKAEKKGIVTNVSLEMPKSFAVCEKNGAERVYISQISAYTLKKRYGKINI